MDPPNMVSFINHSFLVFQVDADTGKSFTFSEIRKYAVQFAAGLCKRGVSKGDCVCLYLTNRIELPIIWFALERLGAVIVLGNASLPASKLYKYDPNLTFRIIQFHSFVPC